MPQITLSRGAARDAGYFPVNRGENNQIGRLPYPAPIDGSNLNRFGSIRPIHSTAYIFRAAIGAQGAQKTQVG